MLHCVAVDIHLSAKGWPAYHPRKAHACKLLSSVPSLSSKPNKSKTRVSPTVSNLSGRRHPAGKASPERNIY
jgi:hypothetical protein